MKKPVTSRALYARIKRHLEKDGIKLCASREGTRTHQDFGRYYSISLTDNAIETKDIDLEELGRELGILKDWEEVGEDNG